MGSTFSAGPSAAAEASHSGAWSPETARAQYIFISKMPQIMSLPQAEKRRFHLKHTYFQHLSRDEFETSEDGRTRGICVRLSDSAPWDGALYCKCDTRH